MYWFGCPEHNSRQVTGIFPCFVMVPPRSLALVAALALFPATLACAKPKPAAPIPAAKAAPALPSVRLQAFSAKHLEPLLAPLSPGPLPRAELLQMETHFKERLAKGNPDEKAMLDAALSVCAGFDKIINEREKAVLSLHPGPQPKTSYRQESKAQQQMAKQSDEFIAASSKKSAQAFWQQRVQPWRVEMQQLLVNEKQAETGSPKP
jgi:hypothetical protein